ncbi:hypothetical protein AX14_013159 [Amanita brunnescens Koide BX004]|nr:hypothetical protein AX14_013159 [Amanita brunnescens Koide BX004]
MLFVRTLLLSFVLALSVAAAPIDLEKWAPAELLPGPLTDAENAEFLAEGGGLWTRVSKSQTANVLGFEEETDVTHLVFEDLVGEEGLYTLYVMLLRPSDKSPCRHRVPDLTNKGDGQGLIGYFWREHDDELIKIYYYRKQFFMLRRTHLRQLIYT